MRNLNASLFPALPREYTDSAHQEFYWRCLSEGRDVLLSEVDFGSFEVGDIDSIRELYFGTLEENVRKADSLACILQK